MSAYGDGHLQGRPERVVQIRRKNASMVLETAAQFMALLNLDASQKWQFVIGTARAYSVLEIYILLSHIIEGPVLKCMLIGS